jgi:hypothetical protein
VYAGFLDAGLSGNAPGSVSRRSGLKSGHEFEWVMSTGLGHYPQLLQNFFRPLRHIKTSKQGKGIDIKSEKVERQDIRKNTEIIRLYPQNRNIGGQLFTHMPD